jgi:hypothetical protein
MIPGDPPAPFVCIPTTNPCAPATAGASPTRRTSSRIPDLPLFSTWRAPTMARLFVPVLGLGKSEARRAMWDKEHGIYPRSHRTGSQQICRRHGLKEQPRYREEVAHTQEKQ